MQNETIGLIATLLVITAAVTISQYVSPDTPSMEEHAVVDHASHLTANSAAFTPSMSAGAPAVLAALGVTTVEHARYVNAVLAVLAGAALYYATRRLGFTAKQSTGISIATALTAPFLLASTTVTPSLLGLLLVALATTTYGASPGRSLASGALSVLAAVTHPVYVSWLLAGILISLRDAHRSEAQTAIRYGGGALTTVAITAVVHPVGPRGIVAPVTAAMDVVASSIGANMFSAAVTTPLAVTLMAATPDASSWSPRQRFAAGASALSLILGAVQADGVAWLLAALPGLVAAAYVGVSRLLNTITDTASMLAVTTTALIVVSGLPGAAYHVTGYADEPRRGLQAADAVAEDVTFNASDAVLSNSPWLGRAAQTTYVYDDPAVYQALLNASTYDLVVYDASMFPCRSTQCADTVRSVDKQVRTNYTILRRQGNLSVYADLAVEEGRVDITRYI